MTAHSIDQQTTGQSFETSAIALGAGLAVGGLVSLSAFLLARYGPTADGWSFRGNGAQAAYALVPAIVAGGWTAVVLHNRRRPWIGLGSRPWASRWR